MKEHPDAQIIREKLPKFIEQHKERQLDKNNVIALNYMTGEKEPIGEYGKTIWC